MTTCPRVRKAIDFIKITNQLERTPGFGTTLGFSSVHLTTQDFGYEKGTNTLTALMPLTASLLWKDHHHYSIQKNLCQPGMLSTFAAIIDEATTVALVTTGTRPGVSVMLSVEAGPALYTLKEGDTVEIASTVQRSGRNLGFTKAEIRLVPTGQLVCTGSHIKFLNNLPFLLAFLFSSWGWPLLKAASDYLLKTPTSEVHKATKTLAEHFGTLESDGKNASFSGSETLSSFGAPLHGGAQAILLERAAETTFSSLSSDNLRLESMQVQYMSGPSLKPKIKISQGKTRTADKNEAVIQTELWSRGKLNSTCIFRYSKV